jgi:hypothetical protein
MFMKNLIVISMLIFSSAYAADSKVHFVKPTEGEVVPATFPVEFKVDEMEVAKAGVMKKGTGHHHLIIDGKPVKKGQAVPMDSTHKHFGDAATSTSLTLAPGKHTLTLQFADGSHLSYGEEYATTINIEVK